MEIKEAKEGMKVIYRNYVAEISEVFVEEKKVRIGINMPGALVFYTVPVGILQIAPSENTVVIEKRIYDYLCGEYFKRNEQGIASIKDRFDRIDKRLKRVIQGEDIFQQGVFDNFPLRLLEVVDSENGIIKVEEPGLPVYMEGLVPKVTNMCVLGISFRDEI